MRLQSAKGVTDIGSLKGKTFLTNFNATNQLIGFYGTVDADSITSLGFIMHDPNCIAAVIEATPPSSLDDSKNGTTGKNLTETTSSQFSDHTGLYVGLILGAAALIAIAAIIGYCIYKRKKR